MASPSQDPQGGPPLEIPRGCLLALAALIGDALLGLYATMRGDVFLANLTGSALAPVLGAVALACHMSHTAEIRTWVRSLWASYVKGG